jgi:hypothetical protein
LGQDHGFGTPYPIPENPIQRSLLFAILKEAMSLDEPDEIYHARFTEASGWYNRKAIEEIKLAEARAKAPPQPSQGNLRTQRRLRHQSRDVGRQPFIIGGIGNPYMDIYSEVPVASLPQPIDNCAWCQYPLSEIQECGSPYCLPCGHMLHLNCITELFNKRVEANEKELCKCPLCNAWFRDLREIPDFYDRYRGREHEFDSDASSSILSDSDAGNEKGDPTPPWIYRLELQEQLPQLLGDEIGTRNNDRLCSLIQACLENQDEQRLTGSPSPPQKSGQLHLLKHFNNHNQDSHDSSNDEYVPDPIDAVSPEPNSPIASPSSTETENGSVLGARPSSWTDPRPSSVATRLQERKRKARTPINSNNKRPNKRAR